MKIIGSTVGGFIVQMTEDEIAKAAGYSSTYDNEWRKAKRSDHAPPDVGLELNVRAAYDFHSRVLSHEREARSCASMMRGLAEMLENAVPSVVIPAPVIHADE